MQDLETEIAVLDTAEKQKRAALVEGRRTYGQLLTALQRMSRLPPEAVVAYPAEPADLVRAAIVLRGVVPQIEGRAASLKDDINSLAETRATIAARRRELTGTGANLRAERVELDKQLAAVNSAQKQTLAERQSEAARLDKLGREAEGLRELFEKLDAERAARAEAEDIEPPSPKPLVPKGGSTTSAPTKTNNAKSADPKTVVASAAPFATRRMSELQGQLPMPAIGHISGQYGEPTPTGISRKGLDIETRPGAQVVAPFDGKVVFAGPLPGLWATLDHRTQRGISYAPGWIVPHRHLCWTVAPVRRAGWGHGSGGGRDAFALRRIETQRTAD